MENEIVKLGITPAFMASSINEFSRERTMLSALTAQHNSSDGAVYVDMEKCEHVYDNIVVGGKQGEYDDMIRRSMVFILLAGEYLGQYTVNELDIAIKNNIRIFVIKKNDELAKQYGFDPTAPANSGSRLTKDILDERRRAVPPSAVAEYGSDEELKAAFENILAAIERECLYRKAKLSLVPYRIGIVAQNRLSYDFACGLADSIGKENDSRAKDAVKDRSTSLLMSVRLLDSVDNGSIGSDLLALDAVFLIITSEDDRSVQTLSALWSGHKELIENKYISSYVYSPPDRAGDENKAVLKKMNEFRHYTSFFGNAPELLDKINGKNKLLDNVRGVFSDHKSGCESYESGNLMNSIHSLEKAAQYFAHSAYMLGMIRKSQGMNEDALKLLSRASYRGHPQAQLEAGKLLFTMNNKQSELFYRMAAESGNAEAMFRLSELYRTDGRNDEALELCMAAADGGCFDAMNTAYVQLSQRGDMRAAHYLSLYTENAAPVTVQGKELSSEDGQIIGGHFCKINSSSKRTEKNYTIFEAEDKNSEGTKRSIKQFTDASERVIRSEITIHKKIYDKLKGRSSAVPMIVESSIKQGYIVTEHFGSENILMWWEARLAPYRTAKKEYQSSIDSDMNRELKDALKKNYLSAARTHKKQLYELIMLFRPLLDDIALMHNNGFIHCDIRCENIMYTEENGAGRLHLINYGMARTIPQVNGGDLIDREEGYFPKNPFAEGTGKIGAEYDIYSVCAVLFRLITGRFPDDCLSTAEQDRLLKEEGAGYSLRTAVLRGLSRTKKRFEAVGYHNKDTNATQKNSLIYYLYHRSPVRSAAKKLAAVLSAAAALTALTALCIFALPLLATPKAEREALADVSSLSSQNILRSDYEWKDKNLFNALAVYESENLATEELLAGNCEYIKTLVINNGKIMLLSSKEAFSNNFDNELYRSDEFKYEKAPVVNKITSVEDIAEFFPNLTTLAIYNCPLANRDINGREYSALSELKELKMLRLANCGYTNMSVFGNGELSKLTWMLLSDGGRLEDMSPLSGLESLKQLVAKNYEYVNLSGLEKIEKLIHLDLFDSSFDAEKLTGLTGLKELIVNTVSAKETEYIKPLSELELLYIHNTDFTGCTDKLGELLKKLPKLSKLSFAGCVFDSFDLLTEQLKKAESLNDLYIYNIKFADGSKADASKLFFINNVEHAPDYSWKDNGVRQLYSRTAGTDKIGFKERKELAEDVVSVVIEPWELKFYKTDISADPELKASEYLNTSKHTDADPDKRITLDDLPELFPSASVLVIRDIIIDNGDISALGRLPGLKKIVLENCGVNSAAVFGELAASGIEVIRLADLGEVKELDALKTLPALTQLTCAQMSFDPKELSELTGLEWLEIYDTSDDRLPDVLENMKSLKFLALNKIRVSDEDALADALLRCTSVETLELREGTFTSVKPLEKLSGMPALKKLDISCSDFGEEDRERLSFCSEVIV